MTGKPVKFETGTGFVTLVCPECSAKVEVVMTLAAKLTIEEGAPGQLRPSLRAKAVEHSCGGVVTEPLFPVPAA